MASGFGNAQEGALTLMDSDGMAVAFFNISEIIGIAKKRMPTEE